MNKQKKNHRIFRLAGIFMVTILIGIGAFLFYRPSLVQAKELFTLYFDIDYVRQESARLFAELFEAEDNPNRIDTQEQIGSLPSLTSPTELILKLKENRTKVNQALNAIDTKSFTDQGIVALHKQVRKFYIDLANFEDIVIIGLENSNDENDRGNFISNIFESQQNFPFIVAEDHKLRTSLSNLAKKYAVDFEPKPYDVLFSEKLVILGRPIISDQYGEVIYSFTVKDTTTIQAVISISSDVPMKNDYVFDFIHPSGKSIELPLMRDIETEVQYEKGKRSFGSKCGEGCIVFKLFPQDPLIMPIAGNWELHVKAAGGSNLVFGFTEF